MIFATDASGKATYVSETWRELTGQSAQDAVNFGWRSVLHPHDRDIVAKIVSKAIKAQREFTVRYRLMVEGGRYIWVAAGAIPSFGPPGHTFLGFLGSITQLSQAPTELIKAYGSVGHYTPPPPHAATLPRSPLELAADHLILAHSLVVEIGDGELLKAVNAALFAVGVELARQSAGGSDSSFH